MTDHVKIINPNAFVLIVHDTVAIDIVTMLVSQE